MSGDTDGPSAPRYVVTGGGTPTPEQLAALAVAMTPVVVADDTADDDAPPSGAASNWAHAALMEGVGHRTFVAMPDLAGGRFPLG